MRIRDISISLAPVVAAAGALGASACDGRVLHIVDHGQLCVTPGGDSGSNPTEPRDYHADEALEVWVSFAACLTSKASDPTTSCGVEQTGNSFVVTARASYFDTDHPKTTGCWGLQTRCETAAVPAGTYTFEYGGNSLELVVPSSGPVPCVGFGLTGPFIGL